MNRRRGLALGTVLACLAALVLILFTAASASLSHLRFVSGQATREHAQNLAEAALSKAIAQLAADDYATMSGTVTVQIPGLNDAEGTVSFDGGGAFSGARQSLNNLSQSGQQVHHGKPVPGRTAYLVARGRVGDVERWMECLLYRPPFPDGLVTNGPVDARALQLYGVRTDDVYVGGDPSTLPPGDVLPGNLLCNSATGFSSGGDSVQLSASSDISGNVASVGQISVSPDTLVAGELRPGAPPRVLPDIDIVDRIAALEDVATPTANTGGDLLLEELWFHKASGGLVVGGDLQLNGSALVVRGDLQVNGAVTGTGIVLVDGDVTISGGGSSVVSGEQVALACTGDLTLQAGGVDGNYFKGLIYCEGDLTARRITVVGSTVVTGTTAGSRGSATIENVRFVYNPGAVQLSLMKPVVEGAYKDGFSDGWHHASVNLLLQRTPDQSGWTCDVGLRLSRVESDNHPTGCATNFHNPSTWQALAGGDPDDYHSTVMRDFPLDGEPPNLGANLGPAIADWVVANEDNNPQVQNAWRALWPARFPSLLRTDSTAMMSLDLNTLFAEFIDDGRLLYWRPLEGQ